MTASATCRRRLTAAVWLALCVLATTGFIELAPAWARVVCLIAAATALRIAIKTLRLPGTPTMRGSTHATPDVVRLRGEISAETADATTRWLTVALSTRPATLEIDMSKVELLTRDGAMAFLTAARIAHKQRTEIIVRNASPQARTVLHTLGLDPHHHYRD
ncbi:STAS domain-containing protein [Streptomyces indicus]|uniref:Anti-anti-sigma regulatory factor (Antagonist of anti-sigma factor) n=1 Tax=Streptomyces indicus TaxID=417292 RepID=A0A1G9GPP4_9ACTN|nr:STAS domain-containing protein [Streptomyces indicus]SDL02582.1 Anti-anti-sigma regulatory factor (antagonist of anti-sigma factor) [Streptomyces indicus]